jgi:hypothetical protein
MRAAKELAADRAVRSASIKFGIAGKSEAVDEIQKAAIKTQRAAQRQSVTIFARHERVARRGADVAGDDDLLPELSQARGFGFAALAPLRQIGGMN